MQNHNGHIKGLFYKDINLSQTAVIDPDNVFWATATKDKNDNSVLSREVIELYQRVKDKLDKELNDFRFSKELTAVYIDTTDKCNANCPYCYIPYKIRKNGKSMSYEQLKYVLNKIADYFSGGAGRVDTRGSCISANTLNATSTEAESESFSAKADKKRKCVIIFHASEPLLTKDIIFKAIKEFNTKFKFGLQTNAILLTKEDVEFLKKYRVGVGISLDAADLNTNNKSRVSEDGGGNFKYAVRAIEWFDGYAGLNVISTINKFNVNKLPKLVEFLHNKKVPCVLMNPVRLTQKNSFKVKPDEGLMAKYFIKAVDKAIELSKKTKNRIIVGNFSNVILGIVAPTARRLMCDISPCGGGRCFFTITARGEMVPCGEFIGIKNFSGGNIFSTSIYKAMESRPFKKIRSRIVEKINECDVCIFRNICGAPCPAELHSMGGMFRKSIFCEFYKAIINHAFKLIAQGEEKYCLRQASSKDLKYAYKL